MPRTLLSAKKVKRYRELLQLRQNEAAKLAGWRRSQSWHKLETRDTDVRISTLVTVAGVLHCGIEDLLNRPPNGSKRAG